MGYHFPNILTSPTIQGVVSAGTGLTMPAFTLGGVIAGGDQSWTGVGDLTFAAGSVIASGSTNGDTLLLKANDTTFLTFATGVTDSLTLNADLTAAANIIFNNQVALQWISSVAGGSTVTDILVMSASDDTILNATRIVGLYSHRPVTAGADISNIHFCTHDGSDNDREQIWVGGGADIVTIGINALDATAGVTIRDTNKLEFRGRYWNGTNQSSSAWIQLFVTAVTPTTDLRITVANGSVSFLTSSDTDDYLTISTISDIPTLTATGATALGVASPILMANNAALQWKSSTGAVQSILNFNGSNQLILNSPLSDFYINYDMATNIHMWGGATGTGLVFEVIGTDAATGAGNVSDAPAFRQRATYRNGANVITNWNFNILHNMTAGGAAPASHVDFSINSVDVLTLVNTNGVISVNVPGELTVGAEFGNRDSNENLDIKGQLSGAAGYGTVISGYNGAAWTAAIAVYNVAAGTPVVNLLVNTVTADATIIEIGAAGTIQSGATNGDTMLLKANDTTFVTFTTGVTDTCDFAASVTIGAAYIYRAGGVDVAVTDGGTGLGAIVAFGTYYASAADTLTVLAPNTAATKMMLSMTGTGAAGQAPVWAALVAGDIPDTSATYLAVAGGTVTGTLFVTNTTPPDVIIDNTTVGADANSGILYFRGNYWVGAANVEVEAKMQLIAGADPYLRISVDDGGATPASVGVIDIHDTVIAVVNTGTVDLGSATNRFNNIYADTYRLADTDASHFLALTWADAEAAANRSFLIYVNAGSRTLDMAANLTVEADSLVNQDLTTDASPAFANLGLTDIFQTSGSTKPSSAADLVKISGVDIAANRRTLALAVEEAVATDAALVSTNSLMVCINGLNYKIMLVAA